MNDVFDEDLMRELGLDPEEIEAVKVPGAKKAPPASQASAPRPAAPQPVAPKPAAPQSTAPQPAAAKAPPKAPPATAPKPPAPVKTAEDVAGYGEKMTQSIPVHLAAVVAKKSLSLKDVIEMRAGEVIDFKKPIGEPIDLVANGKLVAKAELVLVDGRIGARIVKLIR